MAKAVRPVKEAENRLIAFNQERDALCAEVKRRVMAARLAAAARGADQSLEYVLNDAAFHEIRRLESGLAASAEKKRLGDWRELARKLGTMPETEKRDRMEALVGEYCADVVGNFNERVYRFAKGVLPAVLAGVLTPQRLTEGISGMGDLPGKVVIDGPAEQLRACADRGTLVFVPTHSSNMDSVVFGWALDRIGLPPVTYGAGKNLFSNRFISYFMHNLGAYRVDRRLRHALYKDVLKEYSAVLLERGYHSLFFPGGTRSRSGGVERKLKLGLLGTALSAYQQGIRAGAPQRRIYVVPATINYAITLEAETLIDDYLAEEGKARYIIEDDEFSSLGRLYDFTRRILALDESVCIRFGSPLDPFGNAVGEGGESLDARGRELDPSRYVTDRDGIVLDDGQRDAEYTRGLAEEIVRAYRGLTVLMPTHLLARALFDRVTEKQRTRDVYRLLRLHTELEVPIETVRADIARLRDTLARRPELGGILPRYAAMQPGDLVNEALWAFGAYHSRPVAEREGERVVVRHLRLLTYYQNRTAHIGAADLDATQAQASETGAVA